MNIIDHELPMIDNEATMFDHEMTIVNHDSSATDHKLIMSWPRNNLEVNTKWQWGGYDWPWIFYDWPWTNSYELTMAEQ